MRFNSHAILTVISGIHIFLSPCFSGQYRNYPFSRNIYINTTGLGLTGTVVNFPLLVRFTHIEFSGFDNVQPDGRDIRFSKPDGTPLPYEIERWVNRAGNADTDALVKAGADRGH